LTITQDSTGYSDTYKSQLAIGFSPEVTTSWIGNYEDRFDNSFIDGTVLNYTADDDVDTGFAYSWSGTLGSNETKTFTAIYGLQEASAATVNFYRYGSVTPCDTKTALVGGSVKTIAVSTEANYVYEWNTKKDGTGTYYQSNRTVLINEEVVNMYEVKYDSKHNLVTTSGDNVTITPNNGNDVNHRGTVSYTLTPKEGYKVSSVKVNGVEMVDKVVNNILTLSEVTENLSIVVTAGPKYDFIEGANQTFTLNKSSNVNFKINADYTLFDGKVYMDDVLVESSNYTSSSGSTIITLNKDYLNTLKSGNHILKVTFTDNGFAQTTLTVAERNPKTADTIMFSIIGLLFSMLGVCITIKKLVK